MPARLPTCPHVPAVGVSFAQPRALARSACWGFLLGVVLAVAAPAASAKRVALLIGNAAYAGNDRLANPVRDAELLASVLRKDSIRFDTVRVVPNAKRVDMLTALGQFKKEAAGADVALVYYSGHGMINSSHVNHALPVDMLRAADNAQLDPDTALKVGAVSEDEFLDAIQGAKVQLLVLDACRDNGFATTKSGTKGLRPREDQSPARLIAYATGQGRVAQDGQGGNSPYATSLAKHLPQADVPILGVFDAVARDVERETKGKQQPTRSGNLATDVFLAGDAAATAHVQRQQFAQLSQRLASGDMQVLPELQRHPLFLQVARHLNIGAQTSTGTTGRGSSAEQADPTTVAQVVVQSQSSNPEERALAEAMAAYMHFNSSAKKQLEGLRQQGNPYANMMLARVHAKGLWGTTKSEDAAALMTAAFKRHLPKLEQLAKQGNPLAMSWLGNQYRDSKEPAELDKAVQWFRKAAEKGYPYAMTVLGSMLEHGNEGLSKNENQALGWYRKAAEAGDAEGMRKLGLMYEHAKGGLPKDDVQALGWYRKAAAAGSAGGMNSLGVMHEQGRAGLKKDEAQALSWYRKAVEGGDGWGMRNLGVMHEHGRGGLKKDEAQAVNWYRKAAEANNARGMYNLGLMHEEGRGGLNKDEALALKWYRKAAERGDAVGMTSLGRMYEYGKGNLAKDEAQAVAWYRKASELGNSSAQAQLKRLNK
jgi:TPR repeat protein/uncharacterized caspase-like protein